MGGAEPLVRLIESAWKLHSGKKGSGELAVFSNWDELKAAAKGNSAEDYGDPSLQILVRLIEERGARVLPMCNRLRECVDSPESAQVTVSTVHKAKGLEWPRVLVAADFNRFIRRELGVVRRNLEEACVIYVALTRARHQLLIHPDCVKELKASSEACNPESADGNVAAKNEVAPTARKSSNADRGSADVVRDRVVSPTESRSSAPRGSRSAPHPVAYGRSRSHRYRRRRSPRSSPLPGCRATSHPSTAHGEIPSHPSRA